MTLEQFLIFSLLFLLLVFFAWGKFRYDLIALTALVIAVLLKLVPVDEAFIGFAHPAVITVATVLIVSRGLMNAGIIDFIVRLIGKFGDKEFIHIIILIISVTLASALMNNVGALALFMPVTIRMARKNNRSPSLYLMPIAFGSLLGGMMTLIGTPPNIIISSFRHKELGKEPFGMFDFLPVGGLIALAGTVFIILLGPLLLPHRKGKLSRDDLFEIEDYITELRVTNKAKIIGKRIYELEQLTDGDIFVIGHGRGDRQPGTVSPYQIIEEDDTIIVRASVKDIKALIDASGLVLSETEKFNTDILSSKDIFVQEVTITSNSNLLDKSAKSLYLRSGYGVHLLGIARSGERLHSSPADIRFKAGDILLVQGKEDNLQEVIQTFNLLPLQERGLRIGKASNVIAASTIFISAILLSVFGLLPVQISFLLAAIVMVFAKFISLKELYESIDWPIIMLLGAMIPMSRALETTGGAQLIADLILGSSNTISPIISLFLIVSITMLLSNIINNAAAVLLMAPIAVNIALGLDVNVDTFLMGVAIGASSAFLTPIGHQSNTLILEPGGYKFSDYIRLGGPISIIILIVTLPLLLWIWPL